MRYKRQPEEILKEIGIYRPEDIDLELIAYSLGAEIKRTPLSGYEGQIIGTNEKAIITINSNASEQRQRFSAGHECGHWVNDRGKNLSYKCSAGDMKQWFIRKMDFKQNKEVRANQFSADLIMPAFMFVPYIEDLIPNASCINYLSNIFRTSRSSTAIRIVDLEERPCMLVSWEKNGQRKWFSRNSMVPESVFPHKTILHPKNDFKESDGLEVDADKWISNEHSEDYSVIESVISNQYEVLTLVWWQNEDQLVELE